MRRNRNKSDKTYNNNNSNSLPTSDISVGTGRYRDQMTLNTGIPTGLTINPGAKGTDGWVPLICSHGRVFDLEPGEIRVTEFDRVMKDEVYWDIYYKLVNDRGSSAFISSTAADLDFSVTDFTSWFDAVNAALQMYYNIEHVIAFNGTPENRNTGMEYLNRTFITSTIRNKHRILKEKLTRFAIPPRLENFINYIYQNFSMSVDPEAPIIRINYLLNFHAAYDSPSELAVSYDAILQRLEETEKTNALISLVYPQNQSRFLSGVSKYPIYDRGFATFWHNMPVCMGGYVQPTATTDDQKVYYGIIDNHLDGMIYAMAAIFNSAEDDIKPALWMPYISFADNDDTNCNICAVDGTQIYTYANVGTNSGAIKGGSFPEMFWMLNNTNTDASLPPVVENYFCPSNSAQLAMYHSIRNMDAVVNKAARWIFELE
jgi:hypothetical protein